MATHTTVEGLLDELVAFGHWGIRDSQLFCAGPDRWEERQR